MTVTETDPSNIIKDSLNEYDEEFMQIAAVGIGFGAAVFVVRRGWRLVKGLAS